MPLIRPDKGIPIPPGLEPVLYPWDSMEIGDSFAVPLKGRDPKRVKAAFRGNLYRHPGPDKLKPRSFVIGIRQGEVRVWRVK